MRLPLSWLNEFIHIDIDPQQVGKILTDLGLEVDSIEVVSPGFTQVVVGEVVEAKPHPEADQLQVATVSDGKETFQVVCGAPNCRQGLKTAFAKIGAQLPDEGGKTFTIKKCKLRGVESFGMLCSSKELGFGDDHEGIIEFPQEMAVGKDLAAVYGDVVFEISLTPNLGHCQSVIGVARELSASLGKPVSLPPIHLTESCDAAIENSIKVTIQDTEKCPRYTCRVVRGVTIEPSPDWMQKKLIASGVRPINNIVDITNYVLLETGQPLHAFDLDKIAGNQIIVRDARDTELFVTLDEKERSLDEEDLLICDRDKPIAIAGVMGGQNTEVSDATKNILIESAYFHPVTIRKTSKRLGLMTDASKRFERGCDPNGLIRALDRAAMLMQELGRGKIEKGRIDTATEVFPPLSLQLRCERANHLLGTILTLGEIEDVFKRLDFPFTSDGKNTLTVTVPTYRVDITQEIDLVEEVARIYGFDNIPRRPAKYHSGNQKDTPLYRFENQIRNRLVAEGLQEFLTCSLIGPTIENIVNDTTIAEESVVRVLNPTSIEQSTLRTSMLPGLLQVVKNNHDHQCHDILGFEIGNVHFREGEEYRESSVAAIVLTGHSRPYHWDPKPAEVDFYDLKGMVENLLQEMQVEGVSFKNNNLPTFHSGRQAAIYKGAIEIGSFGEVHPAIQRRLDVPQRIFFAEIDLHDLAESITPRQAMTEIAAYPCSERDWTITLPSAMAVEEVLEEIRKIPSRLLEKVSLKDIYQSDKLGKERKNVTFNFVYRDTKKTVSQETVDAEHMRIEKEVIRKIPILGG